VGIIAMIFEKERELSEGGGFDGAFVAIDAKESPWLVDDLAMLHEAFRCIGRGTPCARGFFCERLELL